MIDGVIGLVIKLSPPFFPPQEVGLTRPGSQPQPSNPVIGLFGMARACPETIYGLTMSHSLL